MKNRIWNMELWKMNYGNMEHRLWNMAHGIWNYGIWNMEHGAWNMEYEI
jgi:hypothetical protein